MKLGKRKIVYDLIVNSSEMEFINDIELFSYDYWGRIEFNNKNDIIATIVDIQSECESEEMEITNNLLKILNEIPESESIRFNLVENNIFN